MPDDIDILPQTASQSQMAVLAFVGIVGGGLVAFHAGTAIRDGDLFKTDAVPENPKAGAVATVAGLTLFGFAVKSAVAEVGWKPLVFGSLAIAGAAFVGRALRG